MEKIKKFFSDRPSFKVGVIIALVSEIFLFVISYGVCPMFFSDLDGIFCLVPILPASIIAFPLFYVFSFLGWFGVIFVSVFTFILNALFFGFLISIFINLFKKRLN